MELGATKSGDLHVLDKKGEAKCGANTPSKGWPIRFTVRAGEDLPEEFRTREREGILIHAECQ